MSESPRVVDLRRQRECSLEEIQELLKTHPLNAQALYDMARTFTVKIEFVRFQKPDARLMPVDIDRSGREWLILVHDNASMDWQCESLYHELLHLHLRHILKTSVNDHDPLIHAFIVAESERLAVDPPIAFWELLKLF